MLLINKYDRGDVRRGIIKISEEFLNKFLK